MSKPYYETEEYSEAENELDTYDDKVKLVMEYRISEKHKDQQIAELKEQLADKKREYEVLKILFDIVNNPEKDAMLKQIQGLQKKLDVKGQQIKILQNQLKAQPAEIVKKIRKQLQKQYNWKEYAIGCDGLDYNECVGFNMAIDKLNKVLDTILKEYGGNNE